MVSPAVLLAVFKDARLQRRRIAPRTLRVHTVVSDWKPKVAHLSTSRSRTRWNGTTHEVDSQILIHLVGILFWGSPVSVILGPSALTEKIIQSARNWHYLVYGKRGCLLDWARHGGGS